jgi:imidazolonepropionase-like amidohydrolase
VLSTPDHSVTLFAKLPAFRGTTTVAYTHARIHTMGPKGTLEDATLVVRDGRITAVGARSVPDDAIVIDATGKTLIPGLIDVHAHLHFGRSNAHPQQSWQHAINLAFGVTTVHDPSADNSFVFPTAERIEAGLEKGPRVYSTGSVLYGAKSKDRARVSDLEDARLQIRRMKAMGAKSVKSYQQPAREQRQWLLQAAREERINVYPEGGGDLQMNLNMLLDGHTGIEHSLPQAPLYDDVIGLYAASGAGYTPTLLVAYSAVSGDAYFFQNHNPMEHPLIEAWLPRQTQARMLYRRGLYVADDDWFHKTVSQAAGALADAGVPVLMGAHGQMQGIGAHWELWALAEGRGPEGMRSALAGATLQAAHYIGVEQDLGSLEVGKIADVVVLAEDLFEIPQNSCDIVEVMKDGVRYDPKTLTTLE